MIAGSPYNELLAINGQPLSPVTRLPKSANCRTRSRAARTRLRRTSESAARITGR